MDQVATSTENLHKKISSEENQAESEENIDFEDYHVFKTKRIIRKREYKYFTDPVPLFIDDILKIPVDDEFIGDRTLYGQNFRTIMLYGRAIPLRRKGDRNIASYSIDDGTAAITVMYEHGSKINLDLMAGVNQLETDIIQSRKSGIPYLGGDFKPSNVLCKKQLDNMATLLRVIKKRAYVTQEFFKHGGKVIAMGTPFKNKYSNAIQIWAFKMYEDSGVNRDLELHYKRNLFKLYDERYFNYTLNGTRIRPK